MKIITVNNEPLFPDSSIPVSLSLIQSPVYWGSNCLPKILVARFEPAYEITRLCAQKVVREELASACYSTLHNTQGEGEGTTRRQRKPLAACSPPLFEAAQAHCACVCVAGIIESNNFLK